MHSSYECIRQSLNAFGILIVAIVIVICNAAPYDVSFAKLVQNQAETQSFGNSVSILANGDAVVGGSTTGLVGSAAYGNYDALLQRYTSAGTLMWTTQLGSGSIDQFTAVAVDDNDNIFAAGGSEGGFDGHAAAGVSDIIFAKFDSSGTKVFTNRIGGSNNDLADGIVVDNANNVVYVVGYTSSSVFNGVPRTGNLDSVILKYDSITGDLLDHFQFGRAARAIRLYGVVLDSVGDIWVSGYSNVGAFNGVFGFGNEDFFLQKLSPNGTTLAVTILGGGGSDICFAMAIDASGNMYLTGHTSSATVDGQTSAGMNDILLVKVNSNGVKLWTKRFGGAGHDFAYGVAVDSAHSLVYVTDRTMSNPFHGTTNSIANNAYLLVINAADGSLLYSTVYQSSALISAGESVATNGVRTYISGETGGNFQGQTFTGRLNDGFLLRLEGFTASPTTKPTAPSAGPTTKPTLSPTFSPTSKPTFAPSLKPSAKPTLAPTIVPSKSPSAKPSITPSREPTIRPSIMPTVNPSTLPTRTPTVDPTAPPSESPSIQPSANPSMDPTVDPTTDPSVAPTADPSASPSAPPTLAPSAPPSSGPSEAPTSHPSVYVTAEPSAVPLADPSEAPTVTPSVGPSPDPSMAPIAMPTTEPSMAPSAFPSASPTTSPSVLPSVEPSVMPSLVPTTEPSEQPTASPTSVPSGDPSVAPTAPPSKTPTVVPSTNPSADPSTAPTVVPTTEPSEVPTASPSVNPTFGPSMAPTNDPTTGPTLDPTSLPTVDPTARLDRVCKNSYFEAITTQEAFYAMVGSAVNVRTGGGAVGSAEHFCGSEASFGASVGVPAALTVAYSTATTSPVRSTCSFPNSAAQVTADCDAELPLEFFRSFCPCVDYNCDDRGGAWYLGYTGDSCEATCANVGGECQAGPLSDIVDADSFQTMLAATTVLETNEVIGSTAAASFCSGGTNLYNFASAPAAVSLVHGSFNQTLCAYPTGLNRLHGDCGLSFQAPPAQRFCNCRTATGARKLSVAVNEEAPHARGLVGAPSRLRGGRV
eukprot:gene17579-20025_t